MSGLHSLGKIKANRASDASFRGISFVHYQRSRLTEERDPSSEDRPPARAGPSPAFCGLSVTALLGPGNIWGQWIYSTEIDG